MLPEKLLDLVVRAIMIFVAVLVGGAILYFVGGRVLQFFQAPVQLENALGDNAALKAGAEGTNKAVDDLKAGEQRRKKVSEKAVAAAGKEDFERAAKILATPCSWGATDAECAAGRINRELGLQ